MNKEDDLNKSDLDEKQRAVYVSEEVWDAVDDVFRKTNALRELDDKEQFEKHKHFMEALFKFAIEHKDEIEEKAEEELK
ncbi:hypothetical protein [Halapricum hydrolyticum]|uniref:Uncharacterized protein n=1 Tax=Halapricum hydrolyticum TaxID=2979991 RepID=A0AAE3IEU7_9EURY|nr:hypothetical protein [Halapricum hydrolyticum]MCU4718904.1 hypothetical protein [Halapricum hydrolyticum]MCU4728003.1 hypothetical protein [Halapricum hydrolyticum]